MADNEQLITKYRPRTLKEVVGQHAVVKALADVIKNNRSHCMLFTGDGGTGKTTLARIAADMLGVDRENVQEIDAVTYSGVDAMRDVTQRMNYRPLVGKGIRGIIVDECHGLSKQAWDSLLKATEEPPKWVYWFFCTTNPAKVPKTIVTRSTRFDLKPVKTDDLWDLLGDIADKEKFTASDAVVGLCVREARGSPRQAIANLSICANVKTVEEAGELLKSALETPEAIDLARALIGRQNWQQVQAILAKMKEQDAESVRHVIRAYMTNVILGAKNDPQAVKALKILDQFDTQFQSQDGITPVVIASARVTFGS